MSSQAKRVDVGELFPSPDTVGNTEYLAVYEMLTGAGYFSEGGDMKLPLETLSNMYGSLDELASIAREKSNLVYKLLREGGG